MYTLNFSKLELNVIMYLRIGGFTAVIYYVKTLKHYKSIDKRPIENKNKHTVNVLNTVKQRNVGSYRCWLPLGGLRRLRGDPPHRSRDRGVSGVHWRPAEDDQGVLDGKQVRNAIVMD